MTEAITKPRRSGKHKAFLAFNVLLAMTTVAAGSGLLYANWKLGNRQVVTIDSVPEGGGALNLPPGDLSAKNYLITGSDNSACVDPDSPYAGGFGKRTSFGERSDSIMVIRVNPIDNQAAVISFPRDMWVKQAGSSRSGRINSNFDKKNPNRLIRTVKENFGISVDHYVNIDFCAFAEIVDAVGGVRVPFLFRAQDYRTGFKVLRKNVCYRFAGDHALAYMRSRHYRWYDSTLKKWRTDQSSDWGRIARQQDFMRRMIQKALDKSRTSPRVATNILNAALKNVITDDRLTPLSILQLGQAMKNFNADTMGSYTMPGVGQMIDEASVIVPDFESATSRKILSVFQGKASLSTTVPGADKADPPATVVATTLAIAAAATTTTKPLPTTTVKAVPTTVAPVVTIARTPTTTVPKVTIKQDTRGIVPPNDPTCPF
jgi:LCP family protein required for cell wall assembly